MIHIANIYKNVYSLSSACGKSYEDMYNNGETAEQPDRLDLDRPDLCSNCVDRVKMIRRIDKAHRQ